MKEEGAHREEKKLVGRRGKGGRITRGEKGRLSAVSRKKN